MFEKTKTIPNRDSKDNSKAYDLQRKMRDLGRYSEPVQKYKKNRINSREENWIPMKEKKEPVP